MHLLSVFVSWLTLAIGGTAYHNGAINNFELEFALKYFFYPSIHFQAIVSSKSLILKRNSALDYSFIVLQNFAILIFHWYFWMLPVTFWAFKPDIFAWYLIQIVSFDTLTLLSSWFFVIDLRLNGKTFCNQHHYSFIKPYLQFFFDCITNMYCWEMIIQNYVCRNLDSNSKVFWS